MPVSLTIFLPCDSVNSFGMTPSYSPASAFFRAPFRVLTSLLLCSIAWAGMAQDASYDGLPYNPDNNNDGLIDVSDLLVFLPYYGESFIPDGIIPVAFGGTGSANATGARDSLGLSSIKDSIWGSPASSYTWSNGSMRVMQRFAQGYNITATGLYAHASGTNTSATGAYSNAQNRQTIASATCSSAEGEGTTASGTASHSEGMLSQASALAAHAEGYNTDATSNYSHSEGYATLAGSTAAHAEGFQTNALGLYSHTEGRETDASGTAAHSEGQYTIASGELSHAEGFESIADGYASHAGGYGSTATGLYSRATGRSTVSTATASSAFGNSTIADQENSMVLGQFNLSGATDVLFAIGNGSDDNARSNAMDIQADGTMRLQGNAEVVGEVFVGEVAVGATLDSLMNTISSMQLTIMSLQAQVEALTGGE